MLEESGDYLIDPTDSEQRAALATHYLRIAGEAARSGWLGATESDESVAWEYEDAFERDAAWSLM